MIALPGSHMDKDRTLVQQDRDQSSIIGILSGYCLEKIAVGLLFLWVLLLEALDLEMDIVVVWL